MAYGKTQKPADASKLQWLVGGLLTKLSAELSGSQASLALADCRRSPPGHKRRRAAQWVMIRFAMPPYFFVVTYADHQIVDPDGTLLPADTAAIEYAR